MARKMNAEKKLLSLLLGFGPLSLSALASSSLLPPSHTLPWRRPLFTSEGLKLPAPLGTGMISHQLSLIRLGKEVAWNFQTSRFKGGIAIPAFQLPFNTAEVRLEGGLFRLPARFFTQSCVTGPLVYLKSHSVQPMQLQLGWKWKLENRISLELLHCVGTTSDLSLGLCFASPSERPLSLWQSENIFTNAAKHKRKPKANPWRPPSGPPQPQNPPLTTEITGPSPQSDPVTPDATQPPCTAHGVSVSPPHETASIQPPPLCESVGTEEDEKNSSFFDLHKLENCFDHPPSQEELEKLKRRLTEHQEKLVHSELSEWDHPLLEIKPKLWKFFVHQFVKEASCDQVHKLIQYFQTNEQAKQACYEVVTYKSKNKSSLLHAAALNRKPGVFLQAVYPFVQAKVKEAEFIHTFLKQNIFQCTFLHCFAQSQAFQGNTDELIQFLHGFFKDYPKEYKGFIELHGDTEGTFLDKLAQYKKNNDSILKLLNDQTISSELFDLAIWDSFLFSSLQSLPNTKAALGEPGDLIQTCDRLHQGMGEERFLKLLNKTTDSCPLKGERGTKKTLLHCIAERYNTEGLSTFLSKLIEWFPNHPVELNELLISQDSEQRSFLHLAATKIKDSNDFGCFQRLVETLLEIGSSSEALLCINNKQGNSFLEELLFHYQNAEDIRNGLLSIQRKLRGKPEVLRTLLCSNRTVKNVWRFLNRSTTPGILGSIFSHGNQSNNRSLSQAAHHKEEKTLPSLFPLFCCLVEGDEFTQSRLKKRFKDWEQSFKSFQSFPGLKEALKVRNHSGESFLQVILKHTERDHRKELLKILKECHSWLVRILGKAEGAEVFENLLLGQSSNDLHKAVERCTSGEFSDYFVGFTPEEKRIALHAFIPFFSQRDESGNTFLHSFIKKSLGNNGLEDIELFIGKTKELIPYRSLLPLRNHSGENCLELILRHYVHRAPKSSNLPASGLESLLKLFKELLGEDYCKLFTSNDRKSEEGGFFSWFLIPPQNPARSLDAFNTVLKLLFSSCTEGEIYKHDSNALKALQSKIQEANQEGNHLLHILMRHYAKPSYASALKSLVNCLKGQWDEEALQNLLNQKNHENQGFIDIAFIYFEPSGKPSSSFEEEFKRFVATFPNRAGSSNQSNFVATLAWSQINHWSPDYPGERLKKVLRLLPKLENSKRKEEAKIALEKVVLDLGANIELSAEALGETVKQVELYCHEQAIKLFDSSKETSVLLQLFERGERRRCTKKAPSLAEFLLKFFEGYFHYQKDNRELPPWLWGSASEEGSLWHKAAEQVNQQGGKGADPLLQLLKLFLNQRKSLELLAITDGKGRTFLDILVEQPNHAWEPEKVTEKCKRIGEALACLHQFLFQNRPSSADHPISQLLLNQDDGKEGLLLKAVTSLSVQGLTKILEQYGSTLQSAYFREEPNPIEQPSDAFRDLLVLRDGEGNSFLHIAARLSGKTEGLDAFIALIKATAPPPTFFLVSCLRNKYGKSFLEEYFLACDQLPALLQSECAFPFLNGEISLLNFTDQCKDTEDFEAKSRNYSYHCLENSRNRTFIVVPRPCSKNGPTENSRPAYHTIAFPNKPKEGQPSTKNIRDLFTALILTFGSGCWQLLYPAPKESGSLLLTLFEREGLEFKDFCRFSHIIYVFIRNLSHFDTLTGTNALEGLLVAAHRAQTRPPCTPRKSKNLYNIEKESLVTLFVNECSASFIKALRTIYPLITKRCYSDPLEEGVSSATRLLLFKRDNQGDTVFHSILKRFGVPELERFTHYFGALMTLEDHGSAALSQAPLNSLYTEARACLVGPSSQKKTREPFELFRRKKHANNKHFWSVASKLLYFMLLGKTDLPENHPLSIEKKIIEQEVKSLKDINIKQLSKTESASIAEALKDVPPATSCYELLINNQYTEYLTCFLDLIIDLGEEAIAAGEQTTLRDFLRKNLYAEADIRALLSISESFHNRRLLDKGRVMLEHPRAFLVKNKEGESVCSIWSRMVLEQKDPQKIRALREKFERVEQLSAHAHNYKDPLQILSSLEEKDLKEISQFEKWIQRNQQALDWLESDNPNELKEWMRDLKAARTTLLQLWSDQTTVPRAPEIKSLPDDLLAELQTEITKLRQGELS